MKHATMIAAAVFLLGLSLDASPAQPAAPLRLTLDCTQDTTPTFRLTIANVSATPTAVIVGAILGNGKTYLLERASLTIKRNGAADERLHYVDLSVGVIAGRVDAWLIPLPPGASYSITVPARRFVSRPDYAPGDFANATKVQAHLTTHQMDSPNLDMQGLRFVQVWVGTLTSEWIDVPQACAQ
jgi:hypothetical protein